MSFTSWTRHRSKCISAHISAFGQHSAYITNSFFEESKRITAPDYTPNVSDVLRARTKTTGIYETRFTMGQLSIQYVTEFLAVSSH